jgi:hypothetical protein
MGVCGLLVPFVHRQVPHPVAHCVPVPACPGSGRALRINRQASDGQTSLVVIEQVVIDREYEPMVQTQVEDSRVASMSES